jgi:hypothetical protein
MIRLKIANRPISAAGETMRLVISLTIFGACGFLADSRLYGHCSVQLGLLDGTILPPCVRDTRNKPFVIGANKIEQVGSAVVYLAIHQELERSPQHRPSVIDRTSGS